MKLLKYVMTHDSGLAPNPYFGVCSLALCTPNHMNANLERGDWIVGHTSKATGHRLVYAMRLTRVLDMNEYFSQFPEKHPSPYGTVEQQHGDNMYFREDGRWRRLPSAEHNSVDSFQQDQGRKVYLAEGENRFWYFGAGNRMPTLLEFADQFPWLIMDRQGFEYIHDAERIRAFTDWLCSMGQGGRMGKPRDEELVPTSRYLISVSPEPIWCDAETKTDQSQSTKASCTRSAVRPPKVKRGC
ncbi:hypothetical protein [Pseudomonas sp. NFX98]|uniref:Nmad2 family putative nucleotide modification protein n=1 Tax=Pseudomonas sp. NFX98 TaxID=3399122 RepID=UPI0039FCEC56